MNFRLTAILFGAIFFVGALLLIITFTGDGDSVPTDVLMEELAVVKPENIDIIEMEREGGARLKLVRTGKDKWDVEWDATDAAGGKVPVKAKADPGMVNELVAALLKAKPIAHPELSTNPATHGLQPPGLRVTFRQGTERASTINFGEVLAGGKAVAFVTTSARPDRPLATPRASVEALFRDPGRGKAMDLAKWASDYRVKGVFGDTTSTELVSAINLSAKGKTLGLARSGSGWVFTAPADWGAADPLGDARNPVGFTGVNQLIGTLTNLLATSPADFIETPTPQQLKDFGLDGSNPDAVRVEITNKDGDKLVALIGKKDATPTPAAPGMPPVQANRVWVKVEGQPGVIRATSNDLAGLVSAIENPDPLRDRTLLALDRPRIDGIDISGGVRLRKTGLPPEWKLYGPPTPTDPQVTNLQAVTRLLEVLTERRTIKSFPPANDANFAPGVVQAEVKVWADGFDAPEPKEPKAEPKERGKPQFVTLIFGKIEGDSVFVRRVMPDGSKSDFLLPEKIKIGLAADPIDLVGSLKKSRLELLDPGLKTFSPEVVNKVAVSGVANFVLERDEKKDGSTAGDRWSFAAPPDKKGQTADAATVGEMLRILGTTQSVTKFINEAPDEAALIDYGFLPPKTPVPGAPPVVAPRLKVTVSLKDAAPTDNERTYEFGKETSDPNYVFARQVGRLAVFTVPRLVFDRLATPDLRDRNIFRFDPAQVTAIEFKGWGEKLGAVGDLHLVKDKDGSWSAPVSPTKGYSVDPTKVAALLNTLAATQVKTFVGAAQMPEHGFNDPKESLSITLRIANHPGIILNLGAPTDGGLAYYGLTSIGGGQVITVDAGKLKAYKDGPGVFSR